MQNQNIFNVVLFPQFWNQPEYDIKSLIPEKNRQDLPVILVNISPSLHPNPGNPGGQKPRIWLQNTFLYLYFLRPEVTELCGKSM